VAEQLRAAFDPLRSETLSDQIVINIGNELRSALTQMAVDLVGYDGDDSPEQVVDALTPWLEEDGRLPPRAPELLRELLRWRRGRPSASITFTTNAPIAIRTLNGPRFAAPRSPLRSCFTNWTLSPSSPRFARNHRALHFAAENLVSVVHWSAALRSLCRCSAQ